MFAEQALLERPVLRQLTGLLHQGMHPGDAPGHILILDAMSCLAVVFHHLASPAAAELVELKEDHVTGAGHADTVFLDEFVDGRGFDDGFQEGHQVGVVIEADAAGDHIVREEAKRLGLRLVQPGGAIFPPVLAGFQVRMVREELLRGVVVAAAGLMVTAAHGFVQRVSVLIHIECEAAFPSTGRTGVAGGNPAVFLQVIHCRRDCVHVSMAADRVAAVD